MKILFVENENPDINSSGGIMSYILNINEYLKNKNEVTAIIGQGTDSKSIFTKFYKVADKNISNIKYILLTLKKKRVAKKYDVIHAQRPDFMIPFIFFKKQYKICHLHGAHDVAVFDKKGFLSGLFYSILECISLYFADQIISVDDSTKEHFIKKYYFCKKK